MFPMEDKIEFVWTGLPGRNLNSAYYADSNDALDISWPDFWRKRISYILVVLIIFPL